MDHDPVAIAPGTDLILAEIHAVEATIPTRSVGMILARRFNAGITVNNRELVASATTEISQPSLRDGGTNTAHRSRP